MGKSSSSIELKKKKPSRWLIPKNRIIFYILWLTFQCVVYGYGLWKQISDESLSYMNRLGLSVYLSRGAGLALGVNAALLPLSLCRNLLAALQESKLGKIIPFHEGVFFHRMTAYALLAHTFIHVTAHYVNGFNVLRFDLVPNFDISAFHYLLPSGWTGHGMLLIMVIMYSSSARLVRRKNFENFWYIHHLFVLFFILLWIHPTGCFVKSDEFWTANPMGSNPNYQCKPYYSWIYSGATFALYTVERIMREYRASRSTVVDKVILHPGNTIEIRLLIPSFRKTYKAGQYVFINVPAISAGQWHPFTLTSCPEEPYISVHVRMVGGWTRKLGDRLGYKITNPEDMAGQVMPKIRVDGPFGAPAQDITQYEYVIMVAAGIGFTPFASVLKSVYYASRRQSQVKLKKIHLFWINREMESFEWLQSTLMDLESQFPSGGLLELHMHLTSRVSVRTAYNVVLNDGAEFDPVTGLESRTEYGRPNWDKEFTKISQEAIRVLNIGTDGGPTSTKVGVFVCGPLPLSKTVKRKCAAHSGDQVKFSFQTEHF